MKVLSPQTPTLLLDKKDWRILKELVRNIRQPLSQIAKSCLLSRQSVEYRIKLLQQNLLITGSRAVIDIQKLGYRSYHIFIEIHTPEEEQAILQRAQQAPYVNAIIRYSGKYNVEISMMAFSANQFLSYYEELINNLRIRDDHVLVLMKGIVSQALPSKYFPELKEIKEEIFNPTSKRSVGFTLAKELDLLDIKLLYALSQDATCSNIHLAQQLNVSKDTIPYRIKNLEMARYLLHYRPIINFSSLGLSINSVLIKINHSLKTTKEFEQYLRTQGSILWGTQTFGYYDYLLYIITRNLEEFHEVMNGIKEHYHTIIKTYEILFAYEQLKYSYMTPAIVKDWKEKR